MNFWICWKQKKIKKNKNFTKLRILDHFKLNIYRFSLTREFGMLWKQTVLFYYVPFQFIWIGMLSRQSVIKCHHQWLIEWYSSRVLKQNRFLGGFLFIRWIKKSLKWPQKKLWNDKRAEIRRYSRDISRALVEMT